MLKIKNGLLFKLLCRLDAENGHMKKTSYVVENMTNNVVLRLISL